MRIVFQVAFILAFLAFIDAFGETEFKETEVLSSRTLKKDKSPYLFKHDVLVRPEGELIVEPGVELRFAPEAGITVRGVFNAEGTPEQKIKFVSYEPIGKFLLKKFLLETVTCYVICFEFPAKKYSTF